jgi:hypothetical protein
MGGWSREYRQSINAMIVQLLSALKLQRFKG